jgi:hypothetical protein
MDELLKEMNEESKNRGNDLDFKFKEGANRIRVLTEFQGVKTVNRGTAYIGIISEKVQPQEKDTVSTKGWAWAIIRDTEEFKVVKFGKTLLSQLSALKYDASGEYAFDNFPMPYDITVNAQGAGTKEVIYSITASRKNTDVTEKERANLEKKTSVKDIIQMIKDKQDGISKKSTTSQVTTSYPEPKEGDIPNPEDIPF